MKINEKVKNLISRCKQKKVFLLISLVYNFVWSICKILFGFLTSAYYFCISGVSTIMFGFSKRLYLKNFDNEIEKEKQAKAITVSILIIISGVFFTFYMARLFFIDNSKTYGLIFSIAIAFFSFTELAISIYNFVKAKKRNDLLLKSLRGCSLASSCYAITLTQVALLSATNSTNNFYNAVTGVIFGSFVVLIGIYLLIDNSLNKKTKE